MAKHPVPGRVKTRLARALGEERACALYRAFILDLADRLAALPYAVTWAYWPPAAPFHTLVPSASVRPQRGDDLGSRMDDAIGAALADGAPGVIVIGADVPHIPVAALADAASALAGGADLVLGPASDGGYYLIGLRARRPELFDGSMTWGAADVFDVTVARAGALHLHTIVLAPTFDVDEPADLDRLEQAIVHGRLDLPRTAALVADGSRS